jgi:fatty acid-binding protein DegV
MVSPIAIITDADACIPEARRAALGILTAPPDPRGFDSDEPPIELRRSAVPADSAVARAVIASALVRADTVLYVGLGDGFGGGPAIQEAAANGAQNVRLYRSEGVLMGCGWQVIAAAIAAASGGSATAAEAAAASVRDEVEVLAMLEQPQFAGVSGGLANVSLGGRALVRLRGPRVDVLSRVAKRDAALIELRDRFAAEAASGEGALRVAIHHAGREAAADAMARWTERNLDPAEVVIAPLTRHAASRLGPGMVGVAWYRERGG